MNTFAIGQRWISEMEPELGVGVVVEISARRIRIRFPASDTERQYAAATAPIKRLRFDIGDEIKTSGGKKLRVTAIEESDGLLAYICGDRRVAEQELDSVFSFSSPKERLFSGLYDSNALFNLRVRALHWRARHRGSPAFGFVGPRMELIPHQLYVAAEAAARREPRVLLSDEVGLGKTIEACLILHRLLLSRRIERALIIVPESLVHQWFVELLRRFNLLFRIFDDDYVSSLLETDESRNPFKDEQLILCSLDFLSSDESLRHQAVKAGWDMVIIDEAHHILEDAEEYQLVEKLARQTGGLLLLTATPEQLGHRSHFARLKLLDPSRYNDYDSFLEEAARYHRIAEIANKILSAEPLTLPEEKLLQEFAPQSNSRRNWIKDMDAPERDRLVQQLIDRYGLGRVMFRNTRAAIPNFPKRKVHIIPLQANEQAATRAADEFRRDINEPAPEAEYDFQDDPRLLWLVKFLKSHKSKVLLITHSIDKVKAIETALQKHISLKQAAFHEEMTLLQRDRSAAWFAEKEGARLLLCSEIGSEGRNFQFAHHLVLFDIPLDPELLEQRIGRLDRIGQKRTIEIHVPFLLGSPQEAVVQWHHQGFDAFEQNAAAGFLIFEKFGRRVKKAALSGDRDRLAQIISETQAYQKNALEEMQKGRNRLLELNSYRKEAAHHLKREIQRLDSDREFEAFMHDLFNHFDVQVDELDDSLYYLKTDILTNEEFPLPAFRAQGVPAAFSRKIAVAREDVEFITPDHPMAMGAIDLFLGSEKGNAVLAAWEDAASPELLLEAWFVLECVAPSRLHIDRFFSPTPLRSLVNHEGRDLSAKYDARLINRKIKNSSNTKILENPAVKQNIVPELIENSRIQAKKIAEKIIAERRDKANAVLSAEISRLQALKKINPNVSLKEIDRLKAELEATNKAIASARLRLEAIRLILKGDF